MFVCLLFICLVAPVCVCLYVSSVSKGIVDLHHGSVSVYSEGEGFGCSFTVEVPLYETLETDADAVMSFETSVELSPRERTSDVDRVRRRLNVGEEGSENGNMSEVTDMDPRHGRVEVLTAGMPRKSRDGPLALSLPWS